MRYLYVRINSLLLVQLVNVEQVYFNKEHVSVCSIKKPSSIYANNKHMETKTKHHLQLLQRI